MNHAVTERFRKSYARAGVVEVEASPYGDVAEHLQNFLKGHTSGSVPVTFDGPNSKLENG
jgi:hypothetical protein